ncbi:hypothetical protein TNCV_3639421 [Trichonephila clavipes]|nr:hypothetical protein TNCV_3639421 [Trichonephila clavipes]
MSLLVRFNCLKREDRVHSALRFWLISKKVHVQENLLVKFVMCTFDEKVEKYFLTKSELLNDALFSNLNSRLSN